MIHLYNQCVGRVSYTCFLTFQATFSKLTGLVLRSRPSGNFFRNQQLNMESDVDAVGQTEMRHEEIATYIAHLTASRGQVMLR